MAALDPPAQPLLVVIGSTGTGKSELAVELATRFRGEIVNSDAVQLYDGLPIMTNKIPPRERRGVPHHLLGHIALDDAPWDVDRYRRETSRVIAEIRARGNLPILVGGTQYYVNALLFANALLEDPGEEACVEGDDDDPAAGLDALPAEVLLEELRRCDPVMADRWHPHDRRKILRSLEIYRRTGRPASQHYSSQQRRREAAAAATAIAADYGQPWEKLLLWVHADRDALCERLDRRVDKMLAAGLLDEVRDLFRLKRQRLAAGRAVDTSRGIWQSIGYRQLEPYVAALNEGQPADHVERLRAAAVDDAKAATRRYAKAQVRWARLKLMRRLRDQGPEALRSLYLLDTTDASRFDADAVEPAARLVAQFLRGEPRPLPADLSQRARDVLAGVSDLPPTSTPRRRTCDVCQKVILLDWEWESHIRGSAHRRAMKKKMLALVPYQAPDVSAGAVCPSPPSSPDISSLF